MYRRGPKLVADFRYTNFFFCRRRSRSPLSRGLFPTFPLACKRDHKRHIACTSCAASYIGCSVRPNCRTAAMRPNKAAHHETRGWFGFWFPGRPGACRRESCRHALPEKGAREERTRDRGVREGHRSGGTLHRRPPHPHHKWSQGLRSCPAPHDRNTVESSRGRGGGGRTPVVHRRC